MDPLVSPSWAVRIRVKFGTVAETRKNHALDLQPFTGESDVTTYIPDCDDIDKQKVFLQKQGITPSLRKDVIRVHASSKTCILFLSTNKPY